MANRYVWKRYSVNATAEQTINMPNGWYGPYAFEIISPDFASWSYYSGFYSLNTTVYANVGNGYSLNNGKFSIKNPTAVTMTKGNYSYRFYTEYSNSGSIYVGFSSSSTSNSYDKIYYVTYNYSSTNTETNTSEKGKVYYVVNNSNQIKTIVKTKITNEESEKEFEERVLEIISSMNI